MGRILLEMKLERTAIGAMAVSTAAIDDVIGWVLLGVATALVTADFNGWHLLLQIVCIAGFFLLLQKVIGPALRLLWRKTVHDAHEKGMPNSFLALLLVALFGSCLVTHYLGIFVIFGAFLFGTCLHQEHAIVKAWRDRFSGVVLVAFVPVFFTNTGLNTKIGSTANDRGLAGVRADSGRRRRRQTRRLLFRRAAHRPAGARGRLHRGADEHPRAHGR